MLHYAIVPLRSFVLMDYSSERGVGKENLVMDGLLPTHMVQGERNWYALRWWGKVGKVKSVIVFPFICIYMQKRCFGAPWID